MALNYTVTGHGKPKAKYEGRAPSIGTVIASGDINTTNADSGLFGLLPQKAGQNYRTPDGDIYKKRTVDGKERWVNIMDYSDWFSLEANEEKKTKTKGGGGKSAGQKASSAGSIMNVGTPGGTVIPGTYEGGSGGSAGLLAISPGAVNWKPQVGTLNPLADPNNFYLDLPTIQMPQEQRYINPYLGVLA